MKSQTHGVLLIIAARLINPGDRGVYINKKIASSTGKLCNTKLSSPSDRQNIYSLLSGLWLKSACLSQNGLTFCSRHNKAANTTELSELLQ